MEREALKAVMYGFNWLCFWANSSWCLDDIYSAAWTNDTNDRAVQFIQPDIFLEDKFNVTRECLHALFANNESDINRSAFNISSNFTVPKQFSFMSLEFTWWLISGMRNNDHALGDCLRTMNDATAKNSTGDDIPTWMTINTVCWWSGFASILCALGVWVIAYKSVLHRECTFLKKPRS